MQFPCLTKVSRIHLPSESGLPELGVSAWHMPDCGKLRGIVAWASSEVLQTEYRSLVILTDRCRAILGWYDYAVMEGMMGRVFSIPMVELWGICRWGIC